MTVAVAAGNNCWRFYTSGILSESDLCPTWRDHGVTLVAYTAGVPYQVCTSKWVWTCTSSPYPCVYAMDEVNELEKGNGRRLPEDDFEVDFADTKESAEFVNDELVQPDLYYKCCRW